ncbi:MAG: hypothetical protein KME45_08885 [Stenomitos rutilans HA7619-LM2]|jgi:hypothetical protein|nr:hypothetical protein [Stenomitos rutilans HA7619-LM2]
MSRSTSLIYLKQNVSTTLYQKTEPSAWNFRKPSGRVVLLFDTPWMVNCDPAA